MIKIMSQPFSSLFDGGRTITLEPGQTLFRMGDPVRSVFLITEGRVDLVRHTGCGLRLVLKRASPGEVVAEASLDSETYHCDGQARRGSTVRAIPVAAFNRRLDRAPELARAWAAQLAHALQAARMQAEIRSLRTVADRLDAWLDIHPGLPRRGEIQDLAQVLGVSREALYRELARRRC